jgi:hypothetical protein
MTIRREQARVVDQLLTELGLPVYAEVSDVLRAWR